MEDNDYNIIKPVEIMHNIEALTPAQRREERKRKQQSRKQNEEKHKQELNEPNDGDNHSSEPENKADGHSIDYCA